MLKIATSLACPSRRERHPLSVKIQHEHAFTQGQRIPCIISPQSAVVVRRTRLATGIVFEWCDGIRSTIEEALLRSVRPQIEIKGLMLQQSQAAHPRYQDEDVVFAEGIDGLASQRGARLINYGSDSCQP